MGGDLELERFKDAFVAVRMIQAVLYPRRDAFYLRPERY